MAIGTVSALLIVGGALVLLRFGVQWLGLAPPSGAGAALRVTSSCALGPKRRLLVIEAHGQHLLVSASEQGVSLLRELPPPESALAEVEVESSAEAAPGRWRPLLHLGIPLLLAFGALAASEPALAQSAAMNRAEAELSRTAERAGLEPGPTLQLSLDGATSPDGLSASLEALALLTVLAIAPSILLMATCFTRIVIVLALMRQALGVQHLPPNQVLIGLSLFTTFFVMAPVAEQVRVEAYEPYTRQEIGGEQALELAVSPLHAYMLDFTHERDLDLFLSLSLEGDEAVEMAPEDVPITALLPAFVLSELRAAFEIGFLVYLPFLVIDLVIASMLISMGMIVLPPVVISLPFKLMLFVLLDGWNLVVSSLVAGLR